MSKPPLSIAEQIALLRSRNMRFRGEVSPEAVLASISYYRLKGYWWGFEENHIAHTFKENCYFEDVLELYNFDRHLRGLLFSAIERIEVALRAKLTQHFSLEKGPHWHLESIHFQRPELHSAFLITLEKELDRCKEEFIRAHVEKHPDHHPEAWKALEIMSLGALSKLYKNIRHQNPEKNRIAQEFGLYNQKHLQSWLVTITHVRNIIAHHGRLWNRVLITNYEWPRNTPFPLLNTIPTAYERRKIYPILSAIVYLNDRLFPNHGFDVAFKDLLQIYPQIPLSQMGFPENYLDEPVWNTQINHTGLP